MSGPEFDPESREGREVAGRIADDQADLLALLVHLYRGELGRTTSWRSRIDRTTNWAVVLTATLLTWAFSSETRPHYVLVVGMIMVVLFLVVESRRYLMYDVWRSRVRLIEENVFANALDPEGVEHRDWRALLGEDLREPAIKTPYREAIARRLRRIYLPLLLVLGVAWLVRLSDVAEANVVAAAAIGRVPGGAVVIGVVALYAAAAATAFWPMRRRAKGEFDRDEGAAEEWRGEDRDG